VELPLSPYGPHFVIVRASGSLNAQSTIVSFSLDPDNFSQENIQQSHLLLMKINVNGLLTIILDLNVRSCAQRKSAFAD